MKAIFSQSVLAKAVGIVMRAVSTRTTMPILECILIDARTADVQLIANDMELGIQHSIDAEVEEKGMVAVNARTFSEIIRRLPDSPVRIESDENASVHIRCEKSNFDIPGHKGEEFTFLPIVEREASIRLSQFALRQIINQTIFSIAANENNKLMTGELFEVANNTLRVVSLDGHRIAVRNLKLDQEAEDRRVIVPGKTLGEISHIMDGDTDDPVQVYFSRNHISFEIEGTLIVSRLIDGEYFNISQMLSNDYSTKAEVNKQELTASINRASLLIREADKMPIVFNISDSELELSANTAIGSMDEKLEIEQEGEDIRIGFNPKFLTDALRVIDDEKVTLYFISPIAPCYIRDEEQNYIYLILPVNISR